MKRPLGHIIFILLLVACSQLLWVACHQGDSTSTLRSAYYWSTTWSMDSSKMNFIRTHHIKRLYVRYFDVVKDEAGNIVPNATIQFDTPSDTSSTAALAETTSPIPKGIEVIPVVYIVNDCLRPASQSATSSFQSTASSLKSSTTQLAQKILTRIQQISEANDIPQTKEIQIDCDWTASTQDTYFDFLKSLRKTAQAKGIQLSATIRLHQLSMSPPPVDRGILMMYNTGDAKQLKCQKPILDMKDVAPYIQHLADYPLPLSAAYPLFRWNILFREGKFVGILHKDDDYPILPSDSIVVRQPEMTDIMEAIKSINNQNREINQEVILFDLNDQNIKRFSSEDYEKIYHH